MRSARTRTIRSGVSDSRRNHFASADGVESRRLASMDSLSENVLPRYGECLGIKDDFGHRDCDGESPSEPDTDVRTPNE
jgi:hypothetical protein